MTDIAGERRKLHGQGLRIVRREDWDARQSYTSDRPCDVPATQLFLHISVTQDPDDLAGNEDDRMRVIERIGTERFGATVGFPYNAAAFDTGRLYEGQPITRRGAHSINNFERAACAAHGGSLRAPAWNNNVTARALVLPQMVGDDVTDAQIDAAARWGAALVRSGLAVRGVRWHGHRCITAKDCPGDAGYRRIPELQRLTGLYSLHGLGNTGPTPTPTTTPPAPDVAPSARTENADMDLVLFVIDDPAKPGEPAYALEAGVLRHVSGAERQARIANGGKVPIVKVSASDDVWRFPKIADVTAGALPAPPPPAPAQ